MARISLLNNDIVYAGRYEAIVVPILPNGFCFCDAGRRIQEVANGYYGVQAGKHRKEGGFDESNVFIARGDPNSNLKFRDVIFVIKNVGSQVSGLVVCACKAAEENGYGSIAFPVMMIDSLAGKPNNQIVPVVREMGKGFALFLREAISDMQIYVAESDRRVFDLVRANMKLVA